MSAKPKGLGRGFDALLPENFDNSILVNDDERVQKMLIQDIKPNKAQPRQSFDAQALNELAESIKRHGILQPLIITASADDDGSYMIIAGERRWRAAQIAKLERVPAIIRTAKELEQLEIALIENVQRVDLSPLEQAASIQRLRDQFTMDYEVIAKRLGKASSTIINIARLLHLPPEAKEALQKKHITEGHARAILALKRLNRQLELLGLIKQHKWNVRQAERYVTAHKAGVRDVKVVKERVQDTTPETKALGKVLKTPVNIKRMANGGRLEITFKSDQDLQRIIRRISR